MAKNNVIELVGRDTIVDPLTDLLRKGAEKLIFQAVEAELHELLALHSERRTDAGTAGIVRRFPAST
jgi:putative transposase